MEDTALGVDALDGDLTARAIGSGWSAEKLFRRLAESLPLGMFLVHSDREVGYANARIAGILAVASARTLAEQFATVDAADQARLDAAVELTLRTGADQQLEVTALLPDPGNRAEPSERRCSITLSALSDRGAVSGAIITVADITDFARMRAELLRRASFDVLTGCHNRVSAMATLAQALVVDDPRLAVVFVDLDRFKPVNDTLGRAAGDELLIHVAELLFGQVRADDLVGRIGGDEFLLVCHGIRTEAEGLELAARVQAALDHKVALEAGIAQLAASVGIARSEPGLSAEDLVARAEAAMHESKRVNSQR